MEILVTDSSEPTDSKEEKGREEQMQSSPDGSPRPAVAAEIDPLVRRAVEGDQRAFEQLFKKNAPWVYGRLRRMLGARADLEDLVQEVFLRAYRSLPNYRGQARFEAWLRRITACVAYDEIRSRRCSPRLELIDGEPVVARSKDMTEREAVRQMMRIIDGLPPNNRIVLLLHDVEGYTAEEIRTVVGVKSVNTVRSRLRLARAELHRLARTNPALEWLYRDEQR